MKNEISISSCFDYDIPLEEQMKYIAQAGFTHISLGSELKHSKIFEEGQTEKIKNALNKYGLRIDTIHFSQALSTSNWYPVMENTMRTAKELNCSVVVVHCTSFMGNEIQDDEDVLKLKQAVCELTELCKKYNIRAALENLSPGKPTDILIQLLSASDLNYIGFCYDSSHDQIDGPRPMELLKQMKHRLIALHVSDRIKPFTDHVTIGEGFINFKEMTEILQTEDLDFPFLMEVMKTHSRFKETKEFLYKAYTGAYGIASNIKK